MPYGKLFNQSLIIPLARKICLMPTNNGFVQFFRYLFVGGIAATVDIGSLFAMTSFLHINYLVSAVIAFLLGIITNYALSTLWIFKSRGDKQKELMLFLAIGITGLLLNELVIWALVAKVGLFYLLAKLISTGIVLFWNFGMRKKFVF